MPFYAVFCPLVPAHERSAKGQKGQKGAKGSKGSAENLNLLCPFMTFYALWYLRTKGLQ